MKMLSPVKPYPKVIYTSRPLNASIPKDSLEFTINAFNKKQGYVSRVLKYNTDIESQNNENNGYISEDLVFNIAQNNCYTTQELDFDIESQNNGYTSQELDFNSDNESQNNGYTSQELDFNSYNESQNNELKSNEDIFQTSSLENNDFSKDSTQQGTSISTSRKHNIEESNIQPQNDGKRIKAEDVG
ncbi:unnamed protein product [Rhizophagus irregularis]|nr:unnamed protein product [Rhizophagus irregularis]